MGEYLKMIERNKDGSWRWFIGNLCGGVEPSKALAIAALEYHLENHPVLSDPVAARVADLIK